MIVTNNRRHCGERKTDTTRLALAFSVFAINPLNHPNFAPPNGNLTSPFFGESLSLQGMFANGSFTPGNATYNRKVTLQIQLTF